MDFAPDRLGYLVNSEGLVLMGRADDGEAAGLRLAPIRLDEGPVMPARATTAIRYKANLPRTLAADSADRDVDDAHALAASALAGGDVNIFDARGRTSILRLRWASAGPDRWRLLFRVMGTTLATSVAARDWQIAEQDFVFDARGRLVEGGAITLELGRALEPITLDFGRSGLTQFPDSTALVKVVTCSQNGWPQAALREVAVREDGRILGAFDNSRVELLGVAAFADADPRLTFARPRERHHVLADQVVTAGCLSHSQRLTPARLTVHRLQRSQGVVSDSTTAVCDDWSDDKRRAPASGHDAVSRRRCGRRRQSRAFTGQPNAGRFAGEGVAIPFTYKEACMGVTELPEDYRPSEDEPFMNDRQREYFRQNSSYGKTRFSAPAARPWRTSRSPNSTRT